MIVLEDYGTPLTRQKIVPGNTATGIHVDNITYVERTLAFTANAGAGTGVPLPGQWIVGATSGARAQILTVVVTGGSWAGSDAAGTMRVKCRDAVFTAGEALKIGANADICTLTADPKEDQGYGYAYGRMQARVAMITCQTNTALCDWMGGIPDQTALIGTPLTANSTLTLTNPESIKNFRCIDYTSGSASTLQVILYF
jgi:hypothetical protein